MNRSLYSCYISKDYFTFSCQWRIFRKIFVLFQAFPEYILVWVYICLINKHINKQNHNVFLHTVGNGISLRRQTCTTLFLLKTLGPIASANLTRCVIFKEDTKGSVWHALNKYLLSKKLNNKTNLKQRRHPTELFPSPFKTILNLKLVVLCPLGAIFCLFGPYFVYMSYFDIY